jgi:hypothetical protein
MPRLTCHRVVEELAAILDPTCAGSRTTGGRASGGAAVRVEDRFVDREDVVRLAVILEEAGFAGLAVAGTVIGVGDADVSGR